MSYAVNGAGSTPGAAFPPSAASSPFQSSSSSSPSSSFDDLLAALSPLARSHQASLPAETAAQAARLREEQRTKADKLIDAVKLETDADSLNRKLLGVLINSSQPRTAAALSLLPSAPPLTLATCCVSEPPLFLELSHRFVSSDGLGFLVLWFGRAFDAWQRQTATPNLAPSSSSFSDPSFIPPQLTNQLLLNVLKAWYRVSVYQKERSRRTVPSQPELFAQLRALMLHPVTEIAELAQGLLELYQPQHSAAQQQQSSPPASAASSSAEPAIESNSSPSSSSAATSSSSSSSSPLSFPASDLPAAAVHAMSSPAPQDGLLSVTARIQQEFELAQAAQEQMQQLQRAEDQAAAAMTSITSAVGSASPAASHSPPPDPAASRSPPAIRASLTSAHSRPAPSPPAASPARPATPSLPPLESAMTHAEHAAALQAAYDTAAAANGFATSASSPRASFQSIPTGTAIRSPVPVMAIVKSEPFLPPPPAAAATPPSPPSPDGEADRSTAALASLLCPVCGETASSDLVNYHHVSSVHALLLCVGCALTFPSEKELHAHFDLHNHSVEGPDAQHACGLCGMAFQAEEALALHHGVHTVERKAALPGLVVRKVKKRKLAAATEEAKGSPHRAAKAAKKEKESAAAEDDEAEDGDGGGAGVNRFPPAICSHPSHSCPLFFTSDEDLQSHSVTAHALHLCFAADCGSDCASAAAFAEHLAQHAIAAAPVAVLGVTGGAAPAHCPYCGVVWTKQTPRTEHMHRHEKPFSCPACPARFARRTRWRNHVKRKHAKELSQQPKIFEVAR